MSGNGSSWLAASYTNWSLGERRHSGGPWGDKRAGRQFNGSSAQHIPDKSSVPLTCENGHCASPPWMALLKRRATNWMMSTEWKKLCLPLVFLSLSHMLSLSFLYQLVVSVSPNPFSLECLKRWKDKGKNGDKRALGWVTAVPLRDSSWKSLGMREIGTREETGWGGDHEKRVFKPLKWIILYRETD